MRNLLKGSQEFFLHNNQKMDYGSKKPSLKIERIVFGDFHKRFMKMLVKDPM